jgi:TonB family protein
MIKPTYTPFAMRAGGSGQVIVEIELDTRGNVTKAKAVSGSQLLRKASEDAALSSKFKPAMVGTAAIKAKARIVYSFIAGR